MKKNSCVLALLLCAVLLCGCAAAPLSGNLAGLPGGLDEEADEIPQFEDMAYERPKAALDDLERNLHKLEKAFEKHSSFRTVTHLLDRCYADYYHFDTMYCLAEIRSCQDMTDSYYAEELSWCMDAYYDLQERMEEIYTLCASSDLAQRLEKEYFWEGFAGEYADAELSTYNEETLALMHRESALLAEYRELVAAPTVVLESGREADLYSFLSEADDEEYNEALMAYYRQYNAEMSRIYIDLVKTRRELAAALGFDSYEEMAYAYSFDRDYSPEDAERYIEDIREQIVPVYEELADTWVDYPWLEEGELFDVLRRAAEAMGGEVWDAFSFMSEHGLFDVSFGENKSAKSFQTYLSDYDAPFVFVSPYGDDSDILSFAHEFGHFLDAYTNYNADESIDLAEVFSQAMEYLTLEYLDGALDEQRLENLRMLKWKDTLELYVQQASFAAFEQEVYAADPEKLSADFLNELSLQTAVDFGYYDGVSEEYYALSWIDILHFFEQPFYVISYPVSNDLAMQIWEREQQEHGLGLRTYLAALPREEDGMISTAEAAGLESPFAPGRIARVAQDLHDALDREDAAAA